MTDAQAYRALYGDLINYVEFYTHPTNVEVMQWDGTRTCKSTK